MNGRTIAMVGLLAVALLAPAMVEGAIVQRTYSFTGADLINNVFVDDGQDTDYSLKYFEGARKLTLEETHSRSYVVDQHENFNTTWTSLETGNAVLNHFYLWGHNGEPARLWGEYFKPDAWISQTAPQGWAFSIWNNEIPYWSYGSGGVSGDEPIVAAGGLSVNASPETLAAMEFSITVQFDTDDMWRAESGDDDYKLHGGNVAPNSLDEGLTMWFGSRIYEIDNGELASTYYRYQGNMYATAIPEPASIAIWLLMLLGLVGVACRRPRRGVSA